MWLGQPSRHLLPTTSTTLSTVLVSESVLPTSRTTGDRHIQVPELSKRDDAPFADRLGAAIGAVLGCLLLIAVLLWCCKSRGGSEPSTRASSVTSPPKSYSSRATRTQRRRTYRRRPIRRQTRPIPDDTDTLTGDDETVTSSQSTQGNGTTIDDPGTSRPAEGNQNQTSGERSTGNQPTEGNQATRDDAGRPQPAEENRTTGQAPGNIPPTGDAGRLQPAEGNQTTRQAPASDPPRGDGNSGRSRPTEENQTTRQAPANNPLRGDGNARRPRPAEENQTTRQAPENVPAREDESATQAQTNRADAPPQRDQERGQTPRVQFTEENSTPRTGAATTGATTAEAPTPESPLVGDQNSDHDSQSSTISSAGRTSIGSININPFPTTAPANPRAPGTSRVPQRNPNQYNFRLDIFSRNRTNQQAGAPSAAGGWIRPPQARQPQTPHSGTPPRPPAPQSSSQAAARPTTVDPMRASASARQQALDEGRQMGYRQGIRDGHDLGYRQGYYQQEPRIFPHQPEKRGPG